MKTKIIFLLSLVGSLQANILLESPQIFSEQQVHTLAKSWSTNFTWSWAWRKLSMGSCSFTYENGSAGFAIKLLSVPFYGKGYRILPTMQELKHLIFGPGYYFDTPLEYTKSNPIQMNKESFIAFMKHKKCIFYTGAGLSAAANVPTMDALMRSLKLDKEAREFLEKAWHSPEEIQEAFEAFCESAINNEPTMAHYALKKLAQEKSVAIITENLDLLQHRTGIEPISAYSNTLMSVTENDWQQVDAIICVGLSHDDRGLLARYKRHNPNGILVAIDLKNPNYLSDNDYVCQGNLQEILTYEGV